MAASTPRRALMRIVCPSCAAAYEVPDAVVASGRNMRCARCATEFQPGQRSQPPVPTGPAPISDPATAVLGAPIPTSGAVTAERHVAGGAGAAAPVSQARLVSRLHAILPAPPVLAGWALSLVLLVGIGAGALVWRQAIMHAWPPSTRLYAAFGYLH